MNSIDQLLQELDSLLVKLDKQTILLKGNVDYLQAVAKTLLEQVRERGVR